MASSSLRSKTSHHVRSSSSPSNPHPDVDECLRRLRASSEATTSSSSTCKKLSGLQDLHDGVEKLLLHSTTQRELTRESHDGLLEGSLRLFDLCDTAKEALQQTKEIVRELQSVLRRRRGSRMGFTGELKKCLASRKAIKRAVYKSLKGKEIKSSEKNPETVAVVGLIKEAEAVSFETVRSLVSFIGGSKSPSKLNGWFLVSKIVRSNRVACCDEEQAVGANEIDMLDAAMCAITACSRKALDYPKEVENLWSLLGKLESNVQDLEENLESLCRNLIKTRVSLLNVFNQ